MLRELGRLCFDNTVYLNFETDPDLGSLFEGRLSPMHLVRSIEACVGQAIEPEKTLLILDEVQRSERALNSSSKSLRSYVDEFDPAQVARTTPLSLRKDGLITNYSPYAPCRFPHRGDGSNNQEP